MTPSLQNRLKNDVWDIAPSYLESYVESARGASELVSALGMQGERNSSSIISQRGPVAIIEVNGVTGKRLDWFERMVGMVDYDDVTEAILAAQQDDSIENIILSFDSPGGAHTGTQEAADVIHQSSKPIYAFTDSCMASAAYYLGSQATAVYATPTALVGSIGSILVREDHSGYLKSMGVKITAFARGKHKAEGRSFQPMSKEESDNLNAFVEKAYNSFKASVLRSRSPEKEVFDSRIYHAEDAVKVGLADGIVSSLDELISFLS